MASHVQVILKQSVEHLGKAGEVVRVKPGFARNYLLPRGMALVATGTNLKQVEHERRIALATAEKQRKMAEGSAALVQGLVVEIRMQAGEGDKLFGSVTARDIADALHTHGVDIDRKKLEIPDSIKTLGEYEITAKFGAEVNAKFKVRVLPL
jgi:large subunit ribosomal protein L9